MVADSRNIQRHKAKSEKRDLVALESVVQLLTPFYILTATLMSLVFLTGLRQYAFDPFLGKILFSTYWEAIWITQYAAFSFIMPVAANIIDGGPRTALKYLILFPIFQYSWFLLAWIGVFTYRNGEWMHTAHTRAIEMMPEESPLPENNGMLAEVEAEIE